MGEGRLQGLLLGVVTLLMLRAALTAAWCLRQQQQGEEEEQQQQRQQQGEKGDEKVTRPAVQSLQADLASLPPAAAAAAGDSAMAAGSRMAHPGVPLAAAVALLVCNWGLQRLGLIDRYGQDPHDKTQPSFELLGSHPDAAGVQIQMLAVTLGPLAAVWVGLVLVDGWLRRQQQQQQLHAVSLHQLDGPTHAQSSSSRESVQSHTVSRYDAPNTPMVVRSVTRCAQLTAAVQYCCLALFWAAQLTGWSNVTLGQLLEACHMGGMPVWAHNTVLNTLLQLPLRLLLPRVVYVAALGLIGVCIAGGFGMWVVTCLLCSHDSWSTTLDSGVNSAPIVQDGGTSSTLGGSKESSSSRLGGRSSTHVVLSSSYQKTGGVSSVLEQAAGTARLLVWVIAGLSGPVVMVLGYKGPALLALAGVQAAALLVLLGCCGMGEVAGAAGFTGGHTHSAQAGGACSSNGATTTLTTTSSSARSKGAASRDVAGAGGAHNSNAATTAATTTTTSSSSLGSVSAASRDVLGAVAWSMVAVQLFFCSSHFCEFSGLQYTSSFIGFEDMEWYTSGGLLLVNTWGLTMLCWLSVPLVTLVPDLLMASNTITTNGSSSSRTAHTTSDNTTTSSSTSDCVPRLLCVLLVSASLQWAKLTVCLVSAWVQQGHILLWAIFAPKLVFELWFVVLADVCYLAAAGLVAWGGW
jgi:hypothetical protein